MLKWIGSLLILIDISYSTSAQNLLYGKIYLINSHEIIPEVNLRNLVVPFAGRQVTRICFYISMINLYYLKNKEILRPDH
jgi:hypothetical protein